jgi:hypothetical protein
LVIWPLNAEVIRLDNLDGKNVTFANTTLTYDGGKLRLENARFINCKFQVSDAYAKNGNILQFLNAALTGQPINIELSGIGDTVSNKFDVPVITSVSVSLSANTTTFRGYWFGPHVGRIFMMDAHGDILGADQPEFSNRPGVREVPRSTILTWGDQMIVCHPKLELNNGMNEPATLELQVKTSFGKPSNCLHVVSVTAQSDSPEVNLVSSWSLSPLLNHLGGRPTIS